MIEVAFLVLGIIIFLIFVLIPHSKPEEVEKSVIAMLTTLPERIKSKRFKNVIQRILEQVESVQLNIPPTWKRTGEKYEIPNWIKNHKRIEIVRCQDQGPVTKILGGLDNIKDSQKVVVIDDDIIYQKNFVNRLNQQLSEKQSIACFNVWNDHQNGFDMDLPGGFAGCMSSGKTLKLLKNLKFEENCFNVDDHWLGFAYNKLGIKLFQLNDH